MNIGVACGERWYSLNSWLRNPLFRKLRSARGFAIGPILIWSGK